jgi:TonB family protein
MRTLSCLVAGTIALAVSTYPTAASPVSEPAADEVLPPHVILDTQRPPDFPPAALAGRFSGSVMLQALVLPDGKVGDVKVLSCTRPKVGFEEAAIAAVRGWEFEPGRRNGEPVEFMLKFRLNFASGGPGVSPRVSAGAFVPMTGSSGTTMDQPTSSRDTGSSSARPGGSGGR